MACPVYAYVIISRASMNEMKLSGRVSKSLRRPFLPLVVQVVLRKNSFQLSHSPSIFFVLQMAPSLSSTRLMALLKSVDSSSILVSLPIPPPFKIVLSSEAVWQFDADVWRGAQTITIPRSRQ